MRNVKAKVLTDDEKYNLGQNSLTVWYGFRVKGPRKLPVIAPRIESEAKTVYEYAIEGSPFDSIDYDFSVILILICFPGPVLFLLNFKLLNKRNLKFVDHIVGAQDHVDKERPYECDVENEELNHSELQVTWKQEAIVFSVIELETQRFSVIIFVRYKTVMDQRPDKVGGRREVVKHYENLSECQSVPAQLFVLDLRSLNLNDGADGYRGH